MEFVDQIKRGSGPKRDGEQPGPDRAHARRRRREELIRRGY